MKIKVFLLKDIERVGMAREIVAVSDGYAKNFLFPQKLAVEVTKNNEESFKKRQQIVEKRQEVIEGKTSMLAERIKSLKLSLRRKMHDDGKLYGSVNPSEVVDLLAQRGIKIAKNQVDFTKSIKTKGTHEVTIKLSSRLQPKVMLNILPE
jgi:large subunit ribosomal protein L9